MHLKYNSIIICIKNLFQSIPVCTPMALRDNYTDIYHHSKDGKIMKEVNALKEKTEGKVSVKVRKRIWKNYMDEIINKEDEWDHVTKTSTVKGPTKNVTRKEMVITIKVK